MPNYKYLIIGGGMTGDAAVHGIREVDRTGSIGLIGAERHPAYDRPPLTKGLWKGKPLESIWREPAEPGPTTHLGRMVQMLDPEDKKVRDDQGTIYGYDKLLLATGATPRRLPVDDDKIIYFRTFDDYQHLRSLTERARHFAVIGGGFIGSEIAAALRLNGKEVTLILQSKAVGNRLFPADLAASVTDYYRGKGVQVLAETKVTGIEAPGGAIRVRVQGSESSEREIEVDAVVAGIGVQPNVELAQAAGLAVEDGIRVDAALRTSQPDIYAAGDVANFHNPALDRRLRVEHEDNANGMGRAAGLSMAGQDVTYDYLPMFYSDLFDLGFEAVGEVNSHLQSVADWKEPFREGVVYYLRGSRVAGVLLWNVWEQVDAARQLIAEPGPFAAGNLKGRLP